MSLFVALDPEWVQRVHGMPRKIKMLTSPHHDVKDASGYIITELQAQVEI